MIEAMHVIYQDDSKAAEAQSDLFDSMADAIDECAGIVTDARLQLDAIDREAHDAIQNIIDTQKGGLFGAWATLAMIWAVLVQARAAAEAASAAAAGNIASQAGRIESATVPSPGGKAGPPVQAEPYRPDGQGHFFMAGNEKFQQARRAAR